MALERYVGGEESQDFQIAGVLGEELEGAALRVAGFPKSGEALEESRNPFDVSSLDGIGEVGEFDSQEAADLAQILDCPAGGGGSEFLVNGVDIGAKLHQELGELAVSAKGRVVKRRGSVPVSLVDESRVTLNDSPDICCHTGFCRLNQPVERSHWGTSRLAIAMTLEDSTCSCQVRLQRSSLSGSIRRFSRDSRPRLSMITKTAFATNRRVKATIFIIS